jgi:GNAT superfamily N-acetyltransferase
MKFKRILPNEVSVLTAMARQTFADAFEALNTPEDFEMYLAAHLNEKVLLTELENASSEFWWVCQEDHPVAYFKLNHAPAQSDVNDPKSIELERIYTIAEWQGHGIGSQIIQHIEYIARKEGKEFIWLGVWEKNQRAIAFYERHGFRSFGSHVFILGTDEQTDILLRKDLY